MAAKGMEETLEQTTQDLTAPDSKRIKGQRSGLDARMSTADKRGEEGLGAWPVVVCSGEDHIDALNARVGEMNGRLDEGRGIRERLAMLEAMLVLRA